MRLPPFALSAAVGVFAFGLATSAQEKPSPKAPGATPRDTTAEIEPSKPRLTPRQERGVRLLQSAEAEAADLQPDMQAYVLWQVSHGYQKIAPRKSDALLSQAFASTLSIDKDRANCFGPEYGVRDWLQTGILEGLLKRSPEQVEHLLPKTDERVQQSLKGELFRGYIQKKRFNRAKEMLDRLADDEFYPYYQASDLMQALPESHQEARVTIFNQALTNFQQYNKISTPYEDDFGTMVTRFWHELPPDVVLDAVDALLKQTNEHEEEERQGGIPGDRIWMQTLEGNTYFSSVHQFRLFQMLPILERLDPGRAEDLLRDTPGVKSALDQYPQGMESVPPLSFETPEGKKEEGPGVMNLGPDPGNRLEQQQWADSFRLFNRLSEEAVNDPQKALADALAEPQVSPDGHHPRANALQTVAERTAARDPQVAKAALAELRKQLDGVKPIMLAGALLNAVEIYLKIGDQDSAAATLQEALKWVEKIYGTDADHDSPNLAFKGNWPSVNLWGLCMQLAAKVSLDLPEQIIGEISDPEIVAFERVSYASSLLGAPRDPTRVVECHKDGRGFESIM